MKKIYKISDLDCAVCAAKMEDGVKKVAGVKDASVSFMSQRMTIDYDSNGDIDSIFERIVKVCKKIEPDCTIIK